MPRAEKTTKELKKDLDRITEKYERALEKENRRIADVVRKYFGDEPDMERLDDVQAIAGEVVGVERADEDTHHDTNRDPKRRKTRRLFHI